MMNARGSQPDLRDLKTFALGAELVGGLIHGIEPVKWDGVKGQALLSAGMIGIHLHRFANSAWTATELSTGDPDPWPKSGASDVSFDEKSSAQTMSTALRRCMPPGLR